MTKKHQFHVRLDDDGRARLKALAERLGIDPTDAARYAIKHAFDAVVPVPKPRST